MKITHLSADVDRDRLLSNAALFDGSFSLDWLIALTGSKAGYILAILEEGIQQGFLIQHLGWLFEFKDSEMQNDFRQGMPR